MSEPTIDELIIELETKITEAINQSRLPAAIVKLILRAVLLQIEVQLLSQPQPRSDDNDA